MKTRKANNVSAKANVPSIPEDGKNAPQTPSAGLSPDGVSGAEKTPRVSFFVSPDGTPEWERMLPKTKEQLADILRNPNVQKELGVSPEEAKQIAEMGFGEDEANALLDLIGNINAVAAAKIYGIPGEVTSKAFTFTADHRKKINPPLTRVLNKWAPLMLKTWKDEIGLGIVLFAVLNAQVHVMHMLENQRQKSLGNVPARPPAVPVTPIFKPEQVSPENPVASKEEVKQTGD